MPFTQEISHQLDIDIDKSFQIALKNSPVIQIANEEILCSQDNLSYVQSQFVPELNFFLSYHRQDYYHPYLSNLYYLRPEAFEVLFSASATIYEGGRLRKEYEKAKTMKDIARMSLQKKRLKLYEEVARGYCRVLRAKEWLDFLNKTKAGAKN